LYRNASSEHPPHEGRTPKPRQKHEGGDTAEQPSGSHGVSREDQPCEGHYEESDQYRIRQHGVATTRHLACDDVEARRLENPCLFAPRPGLEPMNE
jgi:hypothetical protein